MNKRNPIRLLLITFLFVLCNFYIFAQPTFAQTSKSIMKQSDTVTLYINQPLQLFDSLDIVLTSFSHKHAMTGGPTKATAYVTISDKKDTINILLSEHGTDGKEEYHFDKPVIWKNWMFELTGFEYDKSITILFKKVL
jgi:hypothetical protein